MDSTRKRRYPAILGLFSIFILAGISACSNPMMDLMQERITEDVETQILGDPPEVVSITPAAGDANAATSSAVTVVFGTDLDETTVSDDSVRLLLLPGLTPVFGSVSYQAETRTVLYTPDTRLDVETTYRLEIGTTVRTLRGAPLGQAYTTEFTTRYFHDDEIGIDLTYTSGDLVLNEGAPIYFQLYRVPLPDPMDIDQYMAILGDMPVTAEGKYRIPQSSIPEGASQALVFMFHDIDGDYTPGNDGAGTGDSERVLKPGEPGNLADPDNETIITGTSGGYYQIADAFVVSIGSGYTISYQDGINVTPDGYETLDDLPRNSQVLTQGIYEIARTLHALDDVDYLRFTPPTRDHYIVETGDTAIDLGMELYATESEALTQSSPLSGIDTGVDLAAGHEYFLRVDSPSSDLGSYKIRYRLRPVVDAAEPNNETPDNPTPLSFGRGNTITASLSDLGDGADRDVYAITVEAGLRYAVEVTETDNPFGAYLDARNLQFGITMYTAWDGVSGSGIWQSNLEDFYQIENGRLVFTASRVNVTSGSETRWLVIENITPRQGGTDNADDPRPSGGYTILYTHGPDLLDEEYDETAGGPLSDDVIDGDTVIGTYVYSLGDTVYERTIYSGTDTETPGSDVDWFRLQAYEASSDHIVIAEPSAADGIVVKTELFISTIDGGFAVPDTAAGVKAAGQPWTAVPDTRGFVFLPYQAWGSSFTFWQTPDYQYFWVRVTRDSEEPGNPITGGYTLTIKAGGDNEDNNYPDDAQTDIGGGTMAGIDETPWIGQPFSGDFSNRNQLSWDGSSPNRQTARTITLGAADQNQWTVYRKDYDYKGEPDGVTDPSTDWDFLWTEIPAGLSGGNFYAALISRSNPDIPLKLTYWKVSAGDWTTYQADEVVLESELGTAEGTFVPTDEENAFEVNGAAEGDIYIFRIERDNDGAGPEDLEGGAYRFYLSE